MNKHSRKFIDLTGQRFGRLRVLEKVIFPDRPGRHKWKCLCDCGTVHVTKPRSLREGSTQSCGCLGRERRLHANKKNAKYLWKLPEYKNYTKMRERCLNPNDPGFHHYGGRGITICQRWLDSFENFLNDMGRRGELANTIERIDVNGNYEPSNCRWATKQEQSYNTRLTKHVTFRGETRSLAEWSKILGVRYHRLNARLVSGWSVEKAFTAPPDHTISQFKKGHNRNPCKIAA